LAPPANRLLLALLPNRTVDGTIWTGLVVAWAVAALLAWAASPWETLPGPLEVAGALRTLWFEEGMGPELFTTMRLIIEALLLTVVLSLALSYASVIAALRPVVLAVSKLRFLGLTGLVFPFMLLTGGGHELKIALLTFGMVSFFVTSMAQVVLEIPREQFDLMRVLGAKEGRIFWEVVVLGTADKALEILRQNAAIGWAMITMVEGISRSQGGIGALILNQNKHFHLAQVYAILIVILIVGLLMDFLLGLLIRVVCPYAELGRVER
jgi:NitT/TauT family transport system permease protein